MKVTAQWSRFLPPCGVYIAAEKEELDARVTPKLVLVTFPRGHVERLPRFDKFGNENKKWRVWQERDSTGCRAFFVDVDPVVEAAHVG